MKSNFRAMLESIADKKLKIIYQGITDEEIKKGVLATKTIELLSKQAVCFSSSVESTPEKWEPALFKLPYPVTWIEFSSTNLPGKLIGHLCVSKQEQITLFGLYKCNGEWIFSNILVVKPDGIGFSLLQTFGSQIRQEDLTARISVLGAFLSALNCCNVKRIKKTPDPALQKARQKRGKLPLFDTWTLEIDLHRAEPSDVSLGGSHESPRMHLRRGHAKHSKATGKWWWVRAHMVGKKEGGSIQKDYKTK